MVNPNILSQRYATREMNAIFSEEGKAGYERDLWLAVLKAQKELGLKIPREAIEVYEEAKAEIDLGLIKEIEMRTKHDVKAKIEELGVGGGYVLASCHTIREEVPAENVRAMYESALEFGGY